MKKGIKSYFVVPSVTINILAWYSLIFGGNITLSCEECKEKSALKSNTISFCYLAFRGNNSLKPSWYIMDNLSSVKKTMLMSIV
jgi:hypothetical protein